jgi:hypothetical protein
MDKIVQYYTAWLKAGSPSSAVEIDLGYMVPIARGERVCPPDAPSNSTPAAIKSLIRQCEDSVTEAAMRSSRCSNAVVQVCHFMIVGCHMTQQTQCIRRYIDISHALGTRCRVEISF